MSTNGQPTRPPLESAASTVSVSSSRGMPSGAMTPRSISEGEGLIDIERNDRQYGTLPEGSNLHQRSKFKKRVKYYVPATSWIPNYTLSSLGGDVLAGLTVASMLIPQSVSYASSLAKLTPTTGLFAASIPGIIYAFLGTSRQLNVAPEAALSLLLGQAVDDIRHDSSDPHGEDGDALGLHVATIITVQAGLFSFFLGLFRLGFIDVVLSRALLRGFITAIAVVISIEQLIPMLGLTALEHLVHPETTWAKFTFIVENLPNMNKNTAAISFGALFVLIFFRTAKRRFVKYWWIYRIPEVLVVVVLSTVLSSQLRWDQDGVDILGSVNVSTGGSFLRFPFRSSNVRYLRRTTSTAVMISVIGYLDSIVAAKQSGARFGYSISPNRELVALGASNIVGSFIPGTLPAYGSITRTRINGDVGGRTQMASLVCSGVILLATFYLLPLLYFLPKCVLASIICLVVISLLSETPHELKYYFKMRSWIDLILMGLTFVLSIIWNVEVGIVVSMIISLLLVVHRSSRARMTILGRIPGTQRWIPLTENPEAEEDVSGALIIRIRENLDFANTAQLKDRLRRLELYGVSPHHPSEEPNRKQATSLVFHMADVETCDASAVEIFYEIIEEYHNRGVGLFLTYLRRGPHTMFDAAGILDIIGPDAIQENVAAAMSRLEMTHR
ncbi:sulfate anion transporter [Hymenopellis radicata]|nr:sulfate anion transporter [Hymenopellis radicata]